MAVTKKGKAWTARAWWTDENGKQHNKQKGGFKTKGAAEEWERQTIEDAMSGAPKRLKGLPLTLAELHEAYTERATRRRRTLNTMSNYDQRARRVMGILGEDTRLTAITQLDVQHVVDQLVADGLAPASVQSFYSLLRTELSYAVSLGCLAVTPCRNIDLPPVLTHQATIYEPSDLIALYSALAETDHPLLWPVVFCGFHGMRRGEALGVRWQDVDLDQGLLHVRVSQTNVSGKGNFLKDPKTPASRDTVALMDDTAAALRDLRQARLALGLYRVGDPDAPADPIPYAELDPREFICLDRNGMLLKAGTLDQRLHHFQRCNDLLVSGWHDLRHTYATLLCEAGEDVVTIQKALRHHSVKTTADMYVQSTTKIKRKATAAFGQIVQLHPQDQERSETN